MIEYKNEVVEMPVKFTSLINDKKVSELNELFNQCILEGWELAAHNLILCSLLSKNRNKLFI